MQFYILIFHGNVKSIRVSWKTELSLPGLGDGVEWRGDERGRACMQPCKLNWCHMKRLNETETPILILLCLL